MRYLHDDSSETVEMTLTGADGKEYVGPAELTSLQKSKEGWEVTIDGLRWEATYRCSVLPKWLRRILFGQWMGQE